MSATCIAALMRMPMNATERLRMRPDEIAPTIWLVVIVTAGVPVPVESGH
jgi:hypothetical protein